MSIENSLKIEFDRLYTSKILPDVEDAETYRLKERNKSRVLGFIIIIAFLAAGIISVLSLMKILHVAYIFCALVAFLVTLIIIISIQSKINDNLRAFLKNVFLTPILKLFGLKLSTSEEISLNEIKSLGLFHKAGRKKDDDNIVGTYKGIPITLVETELSHSERVSKNSTQKVIDFSGLIFKVKMNKKFQGILVGNKKIDFADIEKLAKIAVKENPEMFPPEYLEFFNTPMFKMLVWSGNTIKNLSDKFYFTDKGIRINCSNFVNTNAITRTLEQISLEDPEFNKEFKLFSDNQIEARYIMTPSFMERLKYLQKYFFFTELDFAVKDDYFYLFLTDMTTIETMMQHPQGGLFEIGDVNTSLLDKKLFFKVFKELTQILSFVTYFKLDEKTGL